MTKPETEQLAVDWFGVPVAEINPEAMRRLAAIVDRLQAPIIAERDRLNVLLNTPELHDFAKAAVLEAAHQRERWPAEHDAGKTPADWFWLVGYVAGKALHAHAAGNVDKALHHTITTASVLANWHAAINGTHTAMRPGIATPELNPSGFALDDGKRG